MLKKSILILMVILTITTLLVYGHDEKSFVDVKTTDWYYENLQLLSNKSIVQGNEKGYFMPNDTVMYNQYLKMMVVALTKEALTAKPGEKWDSPYVEKAYELALIADNKKDYNTPISRYEMAQIALKGLSVLKEENVKDYERFKSIITDFKMVPVQYRDSVLEAYAKGLITGYSDGTFGGEKTIKRCESVAVIARLLDKSQRVLPKDTPVEENKPGNIIEEILKGGGADDFFAVVANPTSKSYQALLKENSISIDIPKNSFGLDEEKVFLIPISDNITFSLESIEYKSIVNHFYKEGVIAEKKAKKGELLSFSTYLAESAPQMRIVGVPEWYMSLGVWYCAYDGKGDSDVVYVGAASALNPIKNNINIESLSVAAAISTALERETPELPTHMTPEDLLWTPYVYWRTVTDALTLIANNELGEYQYTQVQFPCYSVHACGEALFPELAHPELDTTYFVWPDAVLTSGVNYGGENCIMQPSDYGNSVIWDVLESKDNPDKKSGFVIVKVSSEYTLEKPVTYKVEWEADMYQDLQSPFQYHLKGLTKID